MYLREHTYDEAFNYWTLLTGLIAIPIFFCILYGQIRFKSDNKKMDRLPFEKKIFAIIEYNPRHHFRFAEALLAWRWNKMVAYSYNAYIVA